MSGTSVFVGSLLFALLTVSSSYGGQPQKLPSIWPPPPPERAIVLTFDDGPRRWIVPRLFLLLDDYGIKAAFFVQGWQAEENPDLILKLHRAGHEIGNHTWNHEALGVYIKRHGEIDGERRFLQDVERGAAVISRILGGRPENFFFRPPLWDINVRVLGELQKRYIVQILDDPKFRPQDLKLTGDAKKIRDVNTEDYSFHQWHKKEPERATAALIKKIKNITKQREKEGIFVHVFTFHELEITIEALKVLIPEWQKAGYRFHTLRWLYGI